MTSPHNGAHGAVRLLTDSDLHFFQTNSISLHTGPICNNREVRPMPFAVPQSQRRPLRGPQKDCGRP
jgi:hypothetical protein